MVQDKVADLVVNLLKSQGVVLRNINCDKEDPEFTIDIQKDKMIYSLEDTLRSCYGILWTMTYGKLNDSNKDYRISLMYNEV